MITLQEAILTGRGVERPFNCHVHNDNNASAYVNVAKGLWYCHSCGAKGKTDDIKPDATMLFKMLEDDLPAVEYPEEWLDVYDKHEPSPYWVERYDAETARAYRCGTDPITGAPTYPMRSITGTVLGVVRRTNGKPKYLTPSGVKTGETLFTHKSNLTTRGLAKKPVVVLVEGPPDVLAIHQAGIPSDWIVAAVFGANLLHGQVEHITSMSPKTVVFAFDDDDAGRAGVQRAKERLTAPIATMSVAWGNFGGKDPGDIPVSMRVQAIMRALETRKQ